MSESNAPWRCSVCPRKETTRNCKHDGDSALKTQSAILIQYHFCQIQRIAPRGPLAIWSVCSSKKTPVFVHSPGSVNGKQTQCLGPSHKQFQPINMVLQGHRREGCHLIKYQQPLAKTKTNL